MKRTVFYFCCALAIFAFMMYNSPTETGGSSAKTFLQKNISEQQTVAQCGGFQAFAASPYASYATSCASSAPQMYSTYGAQVYSSSCDGGGYQAYAPPAYNYAPVYSAPQAYSAPIGRSYSTFPRYNYAPASYAPATYGATYGSSGGGRWVCGPNGCRWVSN